MRAARHLSILALGLFFFSHRILAGGAFVRYGDSESDITEASQQAIILHDAGREDIVLQVKYEGSADAFGWLIPVPSRPEVREGSMGGFYEMSRTFQQKYPPPPVRDPYAMLLSGNEAAQDTFHVAEIKTVGAYTIAVVSTGTSDALVAWLKENRFNLPEKNNTAFDPYVSNGWYFVAVKVHIDNGQPVRVSSEVADQNLLEGQTPEPPGGELQPLVISFDSKDCIFPLAVSAANGKPSEVSMFVLANEPLMSAAMFKKQLFTYRQQMNQALESAWPDHVPGGFELIENLRLSPNELADTAKDLPRLAGRSWWVSKQVQTFKPEEMTDLVFQPEIPGLAASMAGASGEGVENCLADFGPQAVPALIVYSHSPKVLDRLSAATAMRKVTDPRLAAAILDLLADPDPRVRVQACLAAGRNWDASFTDPLRDLKTGSDETSREVAAVILDERDRVQATANFKPEDFYVRPSRVAVR